MIWLWRRLCLAIVTAAEDERLRQDEARRERLSEIGKRRCENVRSIW